MNVERSLIFEDDLHHPVEILVQVCNEPVGVRFLRQRSEVEEPEPRIEVCRICHFLWFDADELTRFTPLPQKEKPGERELAPEARQALAIAEVELAAQRAERSETGDEFLLQIARIFSATLG